jgi:hypothetical protein
MLRYSVVPRAYGQELNRMSRSSHIAARADATPVNQLPLAKILEEDDDLKVSKVDGTLLGKVSRSIRRGSAQFVQNVKSLTTSTSHGFDDTGMFARCIFRNFDAIS